MPSSRDIFLQLVDLFIRYFDTLEQRRALIGAAFFGTDVLSKIQLEGTPHEFTSHIIQTLIQHGEIERGTPAVVRLMHQLRETVGVDKQMEIDALMNVVRDELARSRGRHIGKERIFISYARADDEMFVERLYHDLKDEFDVWWDRETLSNRGKTFLQEIRDAIDWADRLLLVAGPRAFTSDYVRDEWQYAYEAYKGINIALLLGDYTDFSVQLSGFDAPDFRNDADYDERLVTLKRQLAEPVAPIGAFHNVPALPPHFLNRPEALDALRELVIADVDKPTLISAEKRTTAVEGMGGIGKSVLATAFAYDRKVRFAFPDGIVWLTSGRNAKLYELYRAVGVALGDNLSNYPDETTARQNAQKALTGKKCLLILDDVWELSVGRAFRDLISGTFTRLLITTRNLQINDLLNANEYRLKLIDESQAADYLRSWVGEDPKLDEIAEKLGYLFLALKLAGARMKKDNLSGADYLRTFDRVSRMKIDRNANDRDDSLEVSITLGVDAAFAGIEDDSLLYHTFGIFQEDTPIPQQTILQLWQRLRSDVDEFDLLEMLSALVDLALVDRHEDRTITLHDLLHSYTREKLGDRYVQTHQDLLDSYQAEQWHELSPDEPYLWWRIVYHLTEAEHADTLRDLLLDADFLQAKLNATDPSTLITDYDYLPDDSAVRLVQSAIRMSSHILNRDKTQLLNHLYGRLLAHRANQPDIDMLLTAIATHETQPALLTVQQTLQAAGGQILRTFSDHSDRVWAVAFSPDGTQLLSGSIDHTLKLWDTRSGQLLRTYTGHSLGVGAVAFSPDGTQLLSGSIDHTLKLWDVQSGQPLRPFMGHSHRVTTVAFSPDGQYLLSGSWDKTLKLWNAQSGQLLRTFEGHSDEVNAVTFSLDGQYLLSGSSDKTLKLCDAQSGQLLRTFEGHSDRVNAVTFSPDGTQLLSGSSDKTLKLWDVQSGQLLHTFTGHSGSVSAVAFSPDGTRLLSGSWDKTLMLWDIQSGQLLRTFSGHSLGVEAVAFSPDGTRLLSGSWDKTLKLWDAQSDQLTYSLESHSGRMNTMTFSSNGTQLLSGSADGTLKLWDVQSGQLTCTLTGHSERMNAVAAISSDSRFVLSDSGDEILIKLWDVQSGQLLRTFSGHSLGV